ncbi:MAG: Transcription elongation factor GreA [Bacteroidetes bacterium ADurb.Bin174]|nr:MAG: Transcription elongation factor GreA [Bacteroidetes bacterium ADurb.Bin174]
MSRNSFLFNLVLSTTTEEDFNMAVNYMTEEGYRKLKEELLELESVQRPLITQQIIEARDKGDLSENAEYDAAKEAQGLLELKISQIKSTLASARLIDESQISTHEIQIMNRIKIKNVKTGQIMSYLIVSEIEANLREGKLSVNTPIAQGLLGKKVGEKAQVEVPSGILEFEVLEISL